MSVSSKRAQLVELLAGVAPVIHPSVPEEPMPPCVVVQPADPFVQLDPDGQTYEDRGLVVDFDVCCLVPLDDEHDNASATAALDVMLDELLVKLDAAAADWWLADVGQPGGLITTSWVHHGVRATVRTRIDT